jgi:hypothetical protein
MGRRLLDFLPLICLGTLIAGGIVGLLGWQQRTLLQQGSATPQQIRLADLTARGPGDNIHVTVTDFVFGEQYVVEKKGSRWNRVWIPMFPAEQQGGGDIKVLMKTFHIADEGQLAGFYGKQTLTGVITNSIHSLGSGETEELKKAYPGADLSSVWIVEEGREFPTEAGVTRMLVIGGGLLALGVLSGLTLLIGKLRSRGA